MFKSANRLTQVLVWLCLKKRKEKGVNHTRDGRGKLDVGNENEKPRQHSLSLALTRSIAIAFRAETRKSDVKHRCTLGRALFGYRKDTQGPWTVGVELLS